MHKNTKIVHGTIICVDKWVVHTETSRSNTKLWIDIPFYKLHFFQILRHNMFSSRTFTQEPKVCSQLVKMHQTMFIYHMAVIFLKQLDILLKINDETSVGIFQKKRSFNFSFWGFNQISAFQLRGRLVVMHLLFCCSFLESF